MLDIRAVSVVTNSVHVTFWPINGHDILEFYCRVSGQFTVWLNFKLYIHFTFIKKKGANLYLYNQLFALFHCVFKFLTP